MKKIWMVSAVAAAIMMTGCGGGGSSSNTNVGDGGQEEALPEGLTFIMFDNTSGKQYSFDTEHAQVKDMNIEGKNFDMTGKNGKLVGWTDHEEEEQLIAMLNDVDYNILNDGNVSYEKLHYLGHFHDKNFDAHSADEFNPDNNASEEALAELNGLNEHLLEQEEVREELEEALLNVNATGDLCNFIVLGEHEEHDHKASEEEEEGYEHGAAHIAVTTDGYVYIFKENEEGDTHELEQAGVHFLLDGVTNCTETKSDIMQIEEHGVAIFSAETQTLYLVDKHEGEEETEFGTNFHTHSTVKISEFMPAGFTPTSITSIGEGEHDHDH